jgi:hypothetical protein
MMDRLRALWKEHLDFAKVRYLIGDYHRIRAPLAGTLAPAGQPCDVGSSVPPPVALGSVDIGPETIHLPDTADLILLRRARIASPKGKSNDKPLRHYE